MVILSVLVDSQLYPREDNCLIVSQYLYSSVAVELKVLSACMVKTKSYFSSLFVLGEAVD